MKKTTKIILLTCVFLLLAGAGYGYWQKKAAEQPEQRFKLATIENGDVVQTVSANGTLNPVVLVSVGTQVSGTVRKLYVDFNDKVKAGQALLELDDALLSAQVRQSEANLANVTAALELAEANETRMQALFKQEYVSRQEYEQTRQGLKSARARSASTRSASGVRCGASVA